ISEPDTAAYLHGRVRHWGGDRGREPHRLGLSGRERTPPVRTPWNRGRYLLLALTTHRREGAPSGGVGACGSTLHHAPTRAPRTRSRRRLRRRTRRLTALLGEN